jgi:hypothetical protein
LHCSSLLAQAAPAATISRTTFEFGRLNSFTHVGQWALLIGICLAVLWFVWHMYRRDSVELHPVIGVLLALLRTAALVLLLVIYLQPQWRTDEDRVINSRAIVLADTSLSMAMEDPVLSRGAGGSPAGTGEPPVPRDRAQQVARALSSEGEHAGKLIERLRETHDVLVLRFDADLSRIAAFNKTSAEPAPLSGKPGEKKQVPQKAPDPTINWPQVLKPRGVETRLGQALRQVINDERATPVSGILVFTDGGQNAGIEPAVAAELASEARIPLFPVGRGSPKQPLNVRASDLLAPARADPGDAYTGTGYEQGQGLAGQTVTVELYSREPQPGEAKTPMDPGVVEATEQVVLGEEGEIVPIKFELTPSAPGRRELTLRVQAPPSDANPQDNQFGPVEIEVVDRKTRVMLFAGGPAREYIFLRNMLQRDKDVEVDVLLQSAQPGVSQDAHAILDEFPDTREALYEYDCIMAIDPDWQQLSGEQLELLTRWVADQAGGLIVVPGPIHTDAWVQSAAMNPVRTLYPVEFHKRFSLLEDSRFGSKEPWPIEFTREGNDAEFLWLDDSGPASQQIWASFKGVYGYFSVRGLKPGATLYATYSDPRAAAEGSPAYMAGQFFGSGRVFYLGSGEMWRLRELDETYFETFYTKLIRHVSQGRLLRGSNRGVLLVERDRYLLGNTVVVRAQVNDAQLAPLAAPSVKLEIVAPSGELQTIDLVAVPGQEGTFGGQFNVYQEGGYRLELPMPDDASVRLSRRIQVKVPDLERERPARNDALLAELAQTSGGEYFIGIPRALGSDGKPGLVDRLPDRRKTITLTATPVSLWDNQYMMWGICGILCLEWLIRRLAKLA